jgi:hypothetical protein
MELTEFPQAIAHLQTEHLKAEQAVRHWQSQVDRVIGEIESTIAFEKSLTNEAQRKAMRLELMQQTEVQTAMETLQLAQDQKTERAIQLELLRNQFSVAKLAERRHVAELEAGC